MHRKAPGRAAGKVTLPHGRESRLHLLTDEEQVRDDGWLGRICWRRQRRCEGGRPYRPCVMRTVAA